MNGDSDSVGSHVQNVRRQGNTAQSPGESGRFNVMLHLKMNCGLLFKWQEVFKGRSCSEPQAGVATSVSAPSSLLLSQYIRYASSYTTTGISNTPCMPHSQHCMWPYIQGFLSSRMVSTRLWVGWD